MEVSVKIKKMENGRNNPAARKTACVLTNTIESFGETQTANNGGCNIFNSTLNVNITDFYMLPPQLGQVITFLALILSKCIVG